MLFKMRTCILLLLLMLKYFFQAHIESKKVKITLPKHPRTFLMVDGQYYAPARNSRNYDLDYEFIGGGSLAIIKVDTRPSGTNRVVLTSDQSTQSIWLFTSNPDTIFLASMQVLSQENQCTFSVAGVQVKVEQCSQQIIMVLNDGVVYIADFKQELFVPLYLTKDWVDRNAGLTLATNLKGLKNVAKSHYTTLGTLPIITHGGKVLPDCVANYIPSTGSIICRSKIGLIFKSDDVFTFDSSDESGKHFLKVKAYLADLAAIPDGTNIHTLVPWFGKKYSGKHFAG
jgi:hypothetical protein